ncbi:hypothetical protein B0H63DRAFT_544138 [Podospora didyma]|uniref:Uncharacterized protein n=1 Tax=Podospora didyma TaxID=330526 RepID=A0AAE0NQM7_9PEZI|nr:hypothetical protein B0H63DRAFT_544138 [Podospora didyma]
MTDHRRGRRRSDDDGYYYDDTYDRPTRHRSLGRAAMDRLDQGLANLGLNSASKSTTSETSTTKAVIHKPQPSSSPRKHDRPAKEYYHNTHTRRRTYSESPTRHRSHTHRSGRRETAGTTRSAERHRSRRPDSRERSKSRWDHSIEAAIDAAAVEAYRLRKEPGSWNGAKRQRIVTAAVSAGAISAAADNRKNGDKDKVGKMGTIGSAIGGLVVNRLVNGPRREVRY